MGGADGENGFIAIENSSSKMGCAHQGHHGVRRKEKKQTQK